MGDKKADYLKFQRLLQLQKLMSQTELERPRIQSQIDANQMRGRASGASAVHSLFPMLKESGGGKLPSGLGDFQSLVDPAAQEAHSRIQGNYQRKGRLDESLIGNRQAQRGSAEALTDFRRLRTRLEPEESRSRVNRNNSSAALNHITGILRQKGYDDQLSKEAISAVMQHHLDEAENYTARGGAPGQLPKTPSWDQIHQEAEQYIIDKKLGIAQRNGRSPVMNPGMNFQIDGGDQGFQAPPQSSIQPNSIGKQGSMGMSDAYAQMMAQLDPSEDPGNYEEDDSAPDDEEFDPGNLAGMNSYQGPDMNIDKMKMQQMIQQLLREQGIR